MFLFYILQLQKSNSKQSVKPLHLPKLQHNKQVLPSHLETTQKKSSRAAAAHQVSALALQGKKFGHHCSRVYKNFFKKKKKKKDTRYKSFNN